MPGSGVTCDANPATRIMFYDTTHADVQSDLYNQSYAYSKIWACMGRVGSNAVMRNNFVEVGDFPGLAVNRQAGSIQQWDGVALGWQGTEFWNSLTAYPFWLNNAPGDRLVIGCIEPAYGALFHLGAPLATNPTYVVEVLTNATGAGTWSPVTLIKTPDFTQANGFVSQSLEFTPPTTWPELVFGGIGLGESRWFYSIRCVTPAAGSPQGNVNYKDFLTGYFKLFGSGCEVRHGDDGFGTTGSDFQEENAHLMRFRAGPGRRWGNRIVSGKVQIGTLDGSGRDSTRNPWVMICSEAPTIQPAELFGGFICGQPHNPALSGGAGILRGDGGTKGRLVDVTLAGHGNIQLGTSGSGSLKRINRVRVTKKVGLTNFAPIQNIVMVATSANPFTDQLICTVTPGAGDQWGFRSTSTTIDVLPGLVITGDDVSIAQIYAATNPIKWNVIRPTLGGPNKKWGSTNIAGLSALHEWWFLTFKIYTSGGALLPGVVVRAKDSLGFVQLIGTTDGSGTINVFNALSFAPTSVGNLAKNLFCVEDGGDGVTSNPVLRDEGMSIDINPADDPGFNPAYQSLGWQGRFNRLKEYDAATDSWLYHDWQRRDMDVQVRLPLACPSVPPPAPVLIESVPLPGHSEIRYEDLIPAVV